MTAEDRNPKPTTIYINTRPHQWNTKQISFEQLVELAYPGQPPSEQITYTVQYSRGHDGHGTGSLTAGHNIEVKDGMVFDVYQTNRS